MRFTLLLAFLFFFTLSIAQVKDTIPETNKTVKLQDSVDMKAIQDSAKIKEAQDTTKKESRAERKAREKAEKERAKYYYKNIKKDSARLEIEHLSRVAWKRSMILPGWGQYTNKGLWWIKVPIIYGGFVTSYVVFDYWQWYYKEFLAELKYRQEFGTGTDTPLGRWDEAGLIKQKDYTRRNRDLTILVTVGWYGLNIVEAYVDSMLKNRWNVSNDLSLKISPTFLPTYASMPGMGMGSMNGRSLLTPGMKMTFTIK